MGGVCAPPPLKEGQCWFDYQCPADANCVGQALCPCDADCDAPDQFGSCLSL